MNDRTPSQTFDLDDSLGYSAPVVEPQKYTEYPIANEYPPGLGEMAVEEEKAIEKSPEDILNAYTELNNIADQLKDDELKEIGQLVVKEYKIDKESRVDWEKLNDEGLKLATLMKESKSSPWEGAANIKYPLIAQAAIQFNARAYPNIVQDNNIVKGRVVGKDNAGEKASRAERIGRHMSYQLSEQMDDWEAELDALLMTLSITGTEFKKTYYDPTINMNRSELISAENVVVNNKIKRKTPIRITHVYELYLNEIKEWENDGRFLVIDYSTSDASEEHDINDEDAPHTFLEQHRWLDLDDDGYKEPYIVTVHQKSEKVVRITARFDVDGIKKDSSGKVVRITPVEYFTKYIFLPSLDGTYYGIGFGSLLGHTNEVINTTINQLLDCGTNQNTGGGWVSSKVKLTSGGKGGTMSFMPGEYKEVNASGDDIRKSIVERTLPVPSPVLFNILKFLVNSGERLASVTEVLTGQQTLANVPATTTLALIEQGLKPMVAVFKRVHRSLGDEFRKLHRLNRLFLDEQTYYTVLDESQAIARADYDDDDCDVVPVSDPQNMNDSLKKIKAEAILQFAGHPKFNDMEIYKYYMESLQIPDVEKYLVEGDVKPPPDPKIVIEGQKLEIEKYKLDIDERRLELDNRIADAEIVKTEEEAVRAKADAIKKLAEAEAEEIGQQLDQYIDINKKQTDQIRDLTSLVEDQSKLIEQPQEQEVISGSDQGNIRGLEETPGNTVGNPADISGETAPTD